MNTKVSIYKFTLALFSGLLSLLSFTVQVFHSYDCADREHIGKLT